MCLFVCCLLSDIMLTLQHLFYTSANDAAVMARTRWRFVWGPGVWSSLEWIVMSTKYRHFNTSLLARKPGSLPSSAQPPIPLYFSPHLFLKMKLWARQEALIYWILPYPPVKYLSNTHSFSFLLVSLSYPPFSSFCRPSLLLTGGGCSRQMLKCLVWSGFTRRRATRDSPMNSLCVSLSSSHTDTLGVRGRKGRGRYKWEKARDSDGKWGKHE